MGKAQWLDQPEDHDYPAAEAYLRLLLQPAEVVRVIDALHAAPMTTVKAKDLFRSSQLPILDEDNRHVSKDLKRIAKGEPLSPILLLRGDAHSGRPLIVADGYHRACAAYQLDEDVDVPCKLASLTDLLPG